MLQAALVGSSVVSTTTGAPTGLQNARLPVSTIEKFNTNKWKITAQQLKCLILLGNFLAKIRQCRQLKLQWSLFLEFSYVGNVRLIPHTDSHYTTSLIRVDNWAYFIFMSLLQSMLECGYTNRHHHFCSQGWSTIDIYESIYKTL